MNIRAGLFMAMMASFMFLPTFEAGATHIVGGELSYRFVGQNMVEIQLIMRRDCYNGLEEAIFEPTATLRAYDQFNTPVQIGGEATLGGIFTLPRISIDSLSEQLMSGCEVLMDPVCVQEAVYRRVINVKDPRFGNGYTIAYERCCRNTTLTNVLDPLDVGTTLEIRISDEDRARQNRSPILPDFPPIYACIGVPFVVDQGGVDPDGDILTYSLGNPNTGGSQMNPIPSTGPGGNAPITLPPFSLVDWAAGYDLGNLMQTSPALTIDPNTGVLTVTPEAKGQYLVQICVTETDTSDTAREPNRTCREFEINTRPCGDPAVAMITPDDATICDDLEVEFSSAGSMGDVFEWTFGDGTTSTLENPVHEYDTAGCYTVALKVTNSVSDCMAFDTSVICLKNTGVVSNEFLIEMLECNDTIVAKITDQNTYDPTNPIVKIGWTVTEGGNLVAADSGSMITFGLDANAIVEICQQIELANGCEVENCQTVDLKLLELSFDRDQILCLDEVSTITVSHASNDPITVVWDTNAIIQYPIMDPGTSINVLTPDSIVTTLYFTATNEYGCSKSDSIHVTTAGKRPAVSFFVHQDCGSLTIDFVNTSPDTMIDFVWDFGDNMGSSMDVNPGSYTYGMAGTYTITLTGGTLPCDSSYSVTVDIPIIDVEFPDTLIQCFDDSLTLNPGGDASWQYEWSPATVFADPSATSPKILVSEITTVYVNVTVTSGDNFCTHVDSIVIVPVPDFQFDVTPDPTNGDITVCGGDTTIQLTVQTMDGVVVTWKDENGSILHTGDTFNVTLQDGANNFTVMGVYEGYDECMKTESVNIILNKVDLSIRAINIGDGTDMFCDTAQGYVIVTVDGPPGNYTYQWSPTDGVISGQDNDSLLVLVTDNIEYCVTVTNTDLDCSESACYMINLGAEVTLTLQNEGVICVGDTVKVNAAISPTGLDCNIDWTVPGTIVGPDDALTVCYIASGTGAVTATVGCVGGCMADASITVEVRDLSSLISISAVEVPVISEDQIVQLDVIGGETNWMYLWDGPAIDFPTIKNPTSTPGRGEHTYSVMVTDEDGCEGEATLRTPPPPENPCEHPFVFVPTAFSPDGDGTNETVTVRGLDIDEIELFVIYNRWGQEMYRVDMQPTASWDGKYNNEVLASDVYGYYLRARCFNGDVHEEQGNINLIR